MGNEAKTENIVRELLRKKGFYDSPETIFVEEKKSDNIKIDKLLKNASKKGMGQGYPEFIISSSMYPNFIIVIECKADTSNHTSQYLDKYADYAVDGVLLYASYLSKEFDVLAIAVSGQTTKELLINHYIHLRGMHNFSPYFLNNILTIDSYYDGIMTSNVKYNQDYTELIKYTKSLNEELHGKKIKESQRALLISGILIALRNEAFRTSYKKHHSAKSIVDNLYSTIGTELDTSDIPHDRVTKLKTDFSFIKNNTSLTDIKEGREFVEKLVTEIDEKINGFMKTHEYVDTVSQFYIEFLRYANHDKGLGIILTPPHICDLFVELAGVNKDSVVFDNCCGTGGFLISAMQKMMREAKGDIEKEKNIKSQQIVGIEYDDDIYALAISNMIIHLDGRTNIQLGDCFKESEKINEKFNPNVGLLNPPYKTEKTDKEELEYVLNNLETLQPSSKCVAIIPFSCVNDNTIVAKNLKKRILEKHTLEAVMSMSEELFHDSIVNVVTCAIVITAHQPHPLGKKTWFGYWRNDGFVKVKNKGRIDLNHSWDSTKNKWVNAFRNRDIIKGFSLTREVNENDEWCAEKYMETDYSKLTFSDFQNAVKKYIIFNLMDLTTSDKDETEENVKN